MRDVTCKSCVQMDETHVGCIRLKIEPSRSTYHWRTWCPSWMAIVSWIPVCGGKWWLRHFASYTSILRLLHVRFSVILTNFAVYLANRPGLVVFELGEVKSPKSRQNGKDRRRIDRQSEPSNEFLFDFCKRVISSRRPDVRILICSERCVLTY